MKFKDFLSLKESLNEVVKEYEQDFYGTLDESGAGIKRVLKQIENHNFLLISAFRQSYSRKENIQRNNQLIKDIRSELGTEKSGGYKIVGHWKECSEPLKDNETIKDCKGKIVNALEESWLVPSDEPVEKLIEIGKKLAQKYDQDGFIVGDDKGVYLYGKDGSLWETWGKASEKSLKQGFAAIAGLQGYTELKKDRAHGRVNNIVFEGFEPFNIYLSVPKDNNISKQIFEKSGILW